MSDRTMDSHGSPQAAFGLTQIALLGVAFTLLALVYAPELFMDKIITNNHYIIVVALSLVLTAGSSTIRVDSNSLAGIAGKVFITGAPALSLLLLFAFDKPGEAFSRGTITLDRPAQSIHIIPGRGSAFITAGRREQENFEFILFRSDLTQEYVRLIVNFGSDLAEFHCIPRQYFLRSGAGYARRDEQSVVSFAYRTPVPGGALDQVLSYGQRQWLAGHRNCQDQPERNSSQRQSRVYGSVGIDLIHFLSKFSGKISSIFISSARAQNVDPTLLNRFSLLTSEDPLQRRESSLWIENNLGVEQNLFLSTLNFLKSYRFSDAEATRAYDSVLSAWTTFMRPRSNWSVANRIFSEDIIVKNAENRIFLFNLMGHPNSGVWSKSTLFLANFVSYSSVNSRALLPELINFAENPTNDLSRINALSIIRGLRCTSSGQGLFSTEILSRIQRIRPATTIIGQRVIDQIMTESCG